MKKLTKYLDDPIFRIINKVSLELKYKTYIVGGFVRNLILENNSQDNDIDFVCVGDGIHLAKKLTKYLSKKHKLTFFKNFGTAMITLDSKNYEFVGARKESYRLNSRKPLIKEGTLSDDQQRRDFTINAMSISLNKEDYGKLIDPFNGQNDLKAKIIRTPIDPDVTYSDDPLRMMRAIRFASQLAFNIDAASLGSIKRNKDRLSIVSQERITSEFNKILLSEKPSIGLNLLFETKLMEQFLPELKDLYGTETIGKYSHKDNFFHTLEVVDNIRKKTENLWLIWGALLHDIAKPKTKKFEKDNGWTFHGHDFIGGKMVPIIFKKMKLPMNNKMKYVKKMVSLHLRPIVLSQSIVTDSAIRRLLFDAGEDIDDLMKLCEADITSKNRKKVEKYLKNFLIVRKKLKQVEEKDRIKNFQPPVNGKEIMTLFKIQEGKEIGILKNSLKDAILDGIVKNEKKAALEFVINKAKELNLIKNK